MHTDCHTLIGAILQPQGLDTVQSWQRDEESWSKTLTLCLNLQLVQTIPQAANNFSSQVLMCLAHNNYYLTT